MTPMNGYWINNVIGIKTQKISFCKLEI
ncbi:hypothetical protein EHRUM3_04620, partial [Ehrlichia ruminantium]